MISPLFRRVSIIHASADILTPGIGPTASPSPALCKAEWHIEVS
jgi:hypothetical protein